MLHGWMRVSPVALLAAASASLGIILTYQAALQHGEHVAASYSMHVREPRGDGDGFNDNGRVALAGLLSEVPAAGSTQPPTLPCTDNGGETQAKRLLELAVLVDDLKRSLREKDGEIRQLAAQTAAAGAEARPDAAVSAGTAVTAENGPITPDDGGSDQHYVFAGPKPGQDPAFDPASLDVTYGERHVHCQLPVLTLLRYRTSSLAAWWVARGARGLFRNTTCTPKRFARCLGMLIHNMGLKFVEPGSR